MLHVVSFYLVSALRYIFRMEPAPPQPMFNPLPELLEKDGLISVNIWKDIAVRGTLKQMRRANAKLLKSSASKKQSFSARILGRGTENPVRRRTLCPY